MFEIRFIWGVLNPWVEAVIWQVASIILRSNLRLLVCVSYNTCARHSYKPPSIFPCFHHACLPGLRQKGITGRKAIKRNEMIVIWVGMRFVFVGLGVKFYCLSSSSPSCWFFMCSEVVLKFQYQFCIIVCLWN